MSDTLRSDLNGVISALLEAGLGLKSTHVAAVEKAIAELDRLEAEVKKPRLPEGYSVEDDQYRNITVYWKGDDVAEVFSDEDLHPFVEAFLPTPDVVPSTEPVQAGGDGAGVPFAYAYRYHDCIRFNGGHEVNGGKPIEAIPMYTKGQLSAAFSSGAAEMKRAIRQAEPEFHGSGKLDDYNAGWDGGVIAYRYAIAAINPSDVAPAEVPNQDKGYRTPINTETAEKPKPVSLVNRFKIEISHVSALTMGDPVPQLWFSWLVSRVDEELADIRRTLDQARGV